ncbi:UNVERIFIED_ORG: hypothetical protein ABIB52_000729 [Arthrobacter sp. UYCu721]
MANYQVTASQLTPNTTVHIKGKLTYSRLAKLVDGEDLIKADANRVKNGMSPIGRAHTSVNLSDAEVVFANPAGPTLEETFVNERRYVSSKHADHGQCYSMDNKSTNLPIVAVQNAAGEAEQVILEGDLAAGLEVTLVLRVYKPKGYSNCGLSLDLVLLHEPVRYYNPGVNTGELAARGIIFAAPPKQVSGADVVAAGATSAGEAYAAAESLPANTDAATGLPAPAPAAAAVVATPPVVQPAPAPVAPVAHVAPAAQPVESPEQEIARLRATLAARDAASANSGGDSAFGDAPAEDESPWSDPAKQPVGQGISYSG